MNLEFDRPREQLELMAQMYLEVMSALESDRAFGGDYGETVEEGLRVYEIAKAERRI